VGRDADALDAYRMALQLEPPSPQRSFIDRRIRDLTAGWRAAPGRSGPVAARIGCARAARAAVMEYKGVSGRCL
jgi:hypothetical protein